MNNGCGKLCFGAWMALERARHVHGHLWASDTDRQKAAACST